MSTSSIDLGASPCLPCDGGGGSSGSQTGVAYVVGPLDGAPPDAQGGTIASFTFYQQSATAVFPGLVSSANQTFAGVKTFNSAPNFASLSPSAPLRTDPSSNVTVGSISLTNDVTGNLPLSQTSGSLSLVNRVVGNLPLSQTSGSISLTAQVSGILPAANLPPLSGITGSVSLTNQVSGALPLSQTSGSLSLVNQVVGNLPLSQTSGSISLVNQVSGNLPLSQTSGSISLTTQVSGILPIVNVGSYSFTNISGSLPLTRTTGSVDLTNQVVNNLPLSQTSGSLSLVNRVVGNLPLSQTSGSLSLVNQVVGNLPLSQTSGSISLTNQVVGNLPVTNLNTGSAASSSTFWRGDGNWAAVTVSGSISLTTQVSGTLPVVNGGTGVTTSTGTTNVVLSGSPTITTPTFITSATVPLVVGGSGTASTLTHRSTSGVGGAGADQIFQVGNNGATEAMRILNSGFVGIGITAPLSALHVKDSAGTPLYLESSASYSQIQFKNSNNVNGYIAYDGTTMGFYVNNAATPTMTITGSGTSKIGIGTTAPATKLAVAGTLNFTTYDGVIAGYSIFRDSGSTLTLSGGTSGFQFNNNANGAALVNIDNSGNMGIGTSTPSHILQITAQGRATNALWATSSDGRLKDVNGDSERGLSEITQLSIKNFNYKIDNPLNLPSDKEFVGLMAEDVQTIMPEAVEEMKDGFLVINPDPIFWAMVKSIQELKVLCEQNSERIVTLESKLKLI